MGRIYLLLVLLLAAAAGQYAAAEVITGGTAEGDGSIRISFERSDSVSVYRDVSGSISGEFGVVQLESPVLRLSDDGRLLLVDRDAGITIYGIISDKEYTLKGRVGTGSERVAVSYDISKEEPAEGVQRPPDQRDLLAEQNRLAEKVLPEETKGADTALDQSRADLIAEAEEFERRQKEQAEEKAANKAASKIDVMRQALIALQVEKGQDYLTLMGHEPATEAELRMHEKAAAAKEAEQKEDEPEPEAKDPETEGGETAEIFIIMRVPHSVIWKDSFEFDLKVYEEGRNRYKEFSSKDGLVDDVTITAKITDSAGNPKKILTGSTTKGHYEGSWIVPDNIPTRENYSVFVTALKDWGGNKYSTATATEDFYIRPTT